MVVSLLVVLTSAAVFSDSYAHARRLVPVLEVAVPVAAGQKIRPSDVEETYVRVGRSVAVVDASDAGSVVGERAAEPLAPGELLSSSDLTSSGPLAPGDAEVGVVAAPGQMPAGGLVPGDTVMVVETGPPGTVQPGTVQPGTVQPGTVQPGTVQPGTAAGQGAPAPPVLVPAAQVADVRSGPAGSGAAATTLVSLVLPQAPAATVAVAAAADEVGLVLLPAQEGTSRAGSGASVGSGGRGGA